MIDEYDKLIGLIYDGIMDDAAWNLALAQVAQLWEQSASAWGCRICGPTSSGTLARSD